jgi:hypothetical protein
VHGIMENTHIVGLQITATIGNGSTVQEWLPINRTMTA